MAANFKSRTHL